MIFSVNNSNDNGDVLMMIIVGIFMFTVGLTLRATFSIIHFQYVRKQAVEAYVNFPRHPGGK